MRHRALLLLTFCLIAARTRSVAAQAAAGGGSSDTGRAGTPVYPVLCDASTQGCIRQPINCRSVHRSGAGNLGCDYLAAWQRAGDGSGDLELAVGGLVDLDGGYIAVGFRPSKGGNSGSGVLLACYKSPQDSGVHLRLVSADSGLYFLQASGADDARLLTEADSAPQFGADRPELAGYFWPLAGMGHATLECRARLRLGHPLLDWLRNPDVLVHPVGLRRPGRHPLKSDGLAKPKWRYVGPARSLAEAGNSLGPASTGGAKAHGCLMVLAWVLCASVGMLLARYYKLQWPARRLGKELAWFQVHRALMASCCILTLISFIIIFADVAGYSGLDELPDIVHPVLGIIVTILTLANPFISLCRCEPMHDNRPWFNWIHWLVGTVAYILAVINLFLGLRLERAGALRSIDYHIWILIFFVLFQFVLEIFLEIHTLCHWKKNKSRWRQYQQDVQDYQRGLKDAGTLQKPQARPVEPRPVGYCLRTFLLALHFIIAVTVAIILVVVIIVY